MILDFETMEEMQFEQFKGGDLVFNPKMYTDEKHKIMKGRLIPGASIGYHTHETDCEIIFMLEGEGTIAYDGGEETLLPGQCHYCPKGHSHSLMNHSDRDLLFYAVVAEQ